MGPPSSYNRSRRCSSTFSTLASTFFTYLSLIASRQSSQHSALRSVLYPLSPPTDYHHYSTHRLSSFPAPVAYYQSSQRSDLDFCHPSLLSQIAASRWYCPWPPSFSRSYCIPQTDTTVCLTVHLSLQLLFIAVKWYFRGSSCQPSGTITIFFVRQLET